MTKVQEWTYVDRSEFGSGEWDTEPDKLQWVDPDTDLDCLIVRGPHGALCGYVGVPESSKHFEKSYDDLMDFDVHGGLTYADACRESPDNHGICHIPEAGRSDKIWWFGFDCAHCDDLTPGYMRKYPELSRGTYKNRLYVENQIRQLAQQLV